jgi:hypothetical protein
MCRLAALPTRLVSYPEIRPPPVHRRGLGMQL